MNQMVSQILRLKLAVDGNDTMLVDDILQTMKYDDKIILHAIHFNDLLLKAVDNQDYTIVKLLIINCNTTQSLLNGTYICGKIVLKGVLHEHF
jgi:hypothetical protein